MQIKAFIQLISFRWKITSTLITEKGEKMTILIIRVLMA